MKFTNYCLTQWISKLLVWFEIHWVKQYLVYVVLYGIKDLQSYEMTTQLYINLYVRAVNNFPNFDTDFTHVLWDWFTTIQLSHFQ